MIVAAESIKEHRFVRAGRALAQWAAFLWQLCGDSFGLFCIASLLYFFSTCLSSTYGMTGFSFLLRCSFSRFSEGEREVLRRRRSHRRSIFSRSRCRGSTGGGRGRHRSMFFDVFLRAEVEEDADAAAATDTA